MQSLGIPFAQAPVKDLRFLPPQPLTAPSKDPINATTPPLACAQYVSPSPSVYILDAPEFEINVPVSEDCLTLTVWTPSPEKCAQESSGLPVFIWIYGGGFQNGGTEVPYQIPLQWIQRSQDHIVVSLQYRLGIFGYPNAQGLKDQNPGLLDQRAAIEWVKENIAAFGGDPERMVTWGQSAGAFSVDFMAFSYASDPIVKGQICDSGSALVPSYHEAAGTHSNFSYVAQSVGCPSIITGAAPDVELQCMQNIASETLLSFIEGYSLNGTQPSLSFNPVSDNVTVFSNYTDRYALGPGKGVASIPAIFGTNADEGRSLVTYPSPPMNPPNITAANQTTLTTFLCPAAQSTTLRETAGLKTYRYYYLGNFTDVSPRDWLGPYHSSELPQIFGTRGEYRGPASAYEVEVSERMQDLWVAFASDPQVAQGWIEASTGNLNVFAEGSPEGRRAVSTGSIEQVEEACVAAGLL